MARQLIRHHNVPACIINGDSRKKERKKEILYKKRCFEDIISPVGCNSPISLTPKWRQYNIYLYYRKGGALNTSSTISKASSKGYTAYTELTAAAHTYKKIEWWLKDQYQ